MKQKQRTLIIFYVLHIGLTFKMHDVYYFLKHKIHVLSFLHSNGIIGQLLLDDRPYSHIF